MADTEFTRLSGDADLLRKKALHYQEIGNAIARSVNTLGAIGSDDAMTSEAIDALRESAADVGEDIGKARTRYQETAAALITYASALGQAQADAESAITLISSRDGDADAARRRLRLAEQALEDAEDADRAVRQRAVDNAEADLAVAEGSLGNAEQAWRDARDAKNTAAEVAIAAIVNVVDTNNNGLADSWWDDWGEFLFDVLKTICDWAGFLAIFLSWVPILGQILIVLAAIGAIITLLEAIVNAITGEGDWWGVLGAAVGAALTLFGGKIFAFAAKGLKAAMVVRSGARSATALRALQGVGARGEYMLASQALRQVRTPISSVFKAPFVRTPAQASAMQEFLMNKSWAKAWQLTKEAATEAFPLAGNGWDIKRALGVNEDLVSFFKMAADHPYLVTNNMKFIAAAATGYQGYELYKTFDGVFGNALSDPASVVTGFVSYELGGFKGSWDKPFNLGVGTYNLGQDFQQISTGGTTR